MALEEFSFLTGVEHPDVPQQPALNTAIPVNNNPANAIIKSEAIIA